MFVQDFDEVYESIFDFVEQGVMVFTSDLKLVFENITRLFLTDKNSKISQLIKCNPSKLMTFQEIFQQDQNEQISFPKETLDLMDHMCSELPDCQEKFSQINEILLANSPKINQSPAIGQQARTNNPFEREFAKAKSSMQGLPRAGTSKYISGNFALEEVCQLFLEYLSLYRKANQP